MSTALLQRIVAAVGGPEAAPPGIRLRQKGVLRLSGERWLPFEATQTISARTVAFRWAAHLRMAPLVAVRVLDAFQDGRGRLDARLWGLIPMARARGPEVDRGEVLRYLAELPWCPPAYGRNSALAYEDIEADRLRVTALVGGLSASVELTVDAAGDVTRAYASSRPRREGRTFVERPWYGTFSDHGPVGPWRIPRRAAVSWIVGDTHEEVFRGEITALEPA